MRILFMKSLWGMTEKTLEEKFQRIKNAGYDGIETGSPEDEKSQDEFGNLFIKYDLKFVAQQWSQGKNAEEHIKSFEEQFNRNAKFNPILINSHTGRDYFSFEENMEIIKASYEIAEKKSIKLIHETHRARFSFYPRITSEYLRSFNKLKLTADFSHWCCVSESLLEAQDEFVSVAIDNSEHVHGRVGHKEGPQVNDPRAPEWENNLEVHLNWWKRIVENHKAKGSEFLTVTPEFGPPDYMMTLPYTRQPLSDLWDVNLYIKNLLSEELSK
jgi:sugar phosphate isomerase/epimerase